MHQHTSLTSLNRLTSLDSLIRIVGTVEYLGRLSKLIHRTKPHIHSLATLDTHRIYAKHTRGGYQNTQCFFVRGRVVAGGASHRTPSAFTSYVSGSTMVVSTHSPDAGDCSVRNLPSLPSLPSLPRLIRPLPSIHTLSFSGSSNSHFPLLQWQHRHIWRRHHSTTHRSSWASHH